MIRGTTPTHTFNLPFEVGFIKSGKVTYSQDGEIILTKEIKECALDGSTITIKLTQEETLKFNCTKGYVYIQVRLLTTGGDALASSLIRVEVDKCLDSEVLK